MKVQFKRRSLIIFHGPRLRIRPFYVMAIQIIGLFVVSQFVVGVYDGLDECEISQPEIASQSGPASQQEAFLWRVCMSM